MSRTIPWIAVLLVCAEAFSPLSSLNRFDIASRKRACNQITMQDSKISRFQSVLPNLERFLIQVYCCSSNDFNRRSLLGMALGLAVGMF
jgi:hypothetical protein